MEQKYIERLGQVVRVLKELPKDKAHKFDLVNWTNNCGTTACATGWAGSDPWFRKRGFKLGEYSPEFKGYDSWEAVRTFFGLSYDEARYLFSSYEYVRGNRADVWRRIEKFIREKKEGRVA